MSHLVATTARTRAPFEYSGLITKAKSKHHELVLIDSKCTIREQRVDFGKLVRALDLKRVTVLVFNVFGDIAQIWRAKGAHTTTATRMDIALYQAWSAKIPVALMTTDHETIRLANWMALDVTLFTTKSVYDSVGRKSKFKDLDELLAECALRRPNTPDTPTPEVLGAPVETEVVAAADQAVAESVAEAVVDS